MMNLAQMSDAELQALHARAAGPDFSGLSDEGLIELHTALANKPAVPAASPAPTGPAAPEYSAIPQQEGEGLFPWLKMQNERATIGLGKGLKNVFWDAPGQAAAHMFGGGGAAYDAKLREEERLYKPLRDESIAAHGGELVGASVPALAVPGPGAMAGIVKRLGGYAGQGAVGGATQPVLSEGGNFAAEKAKQAGTGATVGAAAGGALAGATNLVAGRIPSNAVARMGNVLHERAMDKAVGQEGARLAEATGMDLTPAMQSGSKGMQLAENAARQSFFTADKVAEVDAKLGNQAIEHVHKLMDKMKKGGGDAEAVGQEVMTGIKNAHTQIRSQRDFYANNDYGKVREIAGDKPFFTFDALIKEAQAVADEYGNIAGADPQKIRTGAAHIVKALMGGSAEPAFRPGYKILYRGTETGTGKGRWYSADREYAERFGPVHAIEVPVDVANKAHRNAQIQGSAHYVLPEGYKPTPGARAPAQVTIDQAMKQRSALSKATQGGINLFTDVQGAEQRAIAVRLLKAAEADFEANGAKAGAGLSEALKRANSRYRSYNQSLEYVAKSPLGQMLGQDLTDAALSGQTINTTAAEKFAQRFLTMEPSQLKVSVNLLRAHAPQAVQSVQRYVLQQALTKGMQLAPSSGVSGPRLAPNKFINALLPDEKMQRIFDKGQLDGINDVVGAIKRWADKSGYNFSGTAPMSEFLAFANGVLNLSLKGAGTAGVKYLGIRQIASAMESPHGREALLTLLKAGPKTEAALKAARVLTTQAVLQAE